MSIVSRYSHDIVACIVYEDSLVLIAFAQQQSQQYDYRITAYQAHKFTSGEIYQLKIFNITRVTRILQEFLKAHSTPDATVIIALDTYHSPYVHESLGISRTAAVSFPSGESCAWDYYPISPHIIYQAAIPHMLLFQYQLILCLASVHLVALTTTTVAHIETLKTSCDLSLFFTKELSLPILHNALNHAATLVNYPQSSAILDKKTMITARGLYRIVKLYYQEL